jgi:PhnB protein
MVKAIPEGYTSVTPYLIFENAGSAIEFYKKAFGAKELVRMPMGARIAHAELQIGNARIMLADENPQMNAHSPKHHNGSPVGFMFYVEDADQAAERAVAAGATVVRPVENQFYGDRTGTFLDPYGYKWSIGTHVEDVSSEEMKKRMAKMSGGS